MILQLMSVFIGVRGFGIILEVPQKYLPYSGIAGAVGWAAYLLGQQFLPVGSIFFSSFFIITSPAINLDPAGMKPTAVFPGQQLIIRIRIQSVFHQCFDQPAGNFLILNEPLLSNVASQKTSVGWTLCGTSVKTRSLKSYKAKTIPPCVV